MTSLTPQQIGLYAMAMAVLFAVPGPAWLMLVSRCLHHGFLAAIAVAIGIGLGDLVWPAIALISLTTLATIHLDLLDWLRYLAVAMFVILGITMLVSKPKPLRADPDPDSANAHKDKWFMGIMAGLAAVFANPKAILFYLGILPGFFSIEALTLIDIVVISLLSSLIPLVGNIGLALLVGKIASLISSASAMRLMHRITGVVMIGVGLAIFLAH